MQIQNNNNNQPYFGQAVKLRIKTPEVYQYLKIESRLCRESTNARFEVKVDPNIDPEGFYRATIFSEMESRQLSWAQARENKLNIKIEKARSPLRLAVLNWQLECAKKAKRTLFEKLEAKADEKVIVRREDIANIPTFEAF